MLRIAHVVKRTIESNSQPFVGIENQRIRVFNPLPHRAAFRKNHSRTRHGSVDVQPDVIFLRDACNRFNRIEGGRDSRAGSCDHGARFQTGREIALDCGFERVGAHRKVLIVLDNVSRQSRKHCGFVHRAMTVRGDVDNISGFLARANKRYQSASRGRILNDAGPVVRKPDHLAHPIGSYFFQLGKRGTRLPRQAKHAQTSAGVIA